MILDEIVKREELEVDNDALDSEFNQTLNALAMQGLDFGKIRGGKKGQERIAQAVAMESANRVLTRRALDMLKSIAVGEYKSPEERKAEAAAKAEEGLAKSEMISEGSPVVSNEEAMESESPVPVVMTGEAASKEADEPDPSSEEETKS